MSIHRETSHGIKGLETVPFPLIGGYYMKAISKQDLQGVRTAPELERKYQFNQRFADILGVAEDAQTAADEAKSATETLDSNLTPDEIFNRLTDGGKRQGVYKDLETDDYYVSASYIKTGELNASLIKAGVIKSQDNEGVVINLDSGTVDLTGSLKTEAVYEDGEEQRCMVYPNHTIVVRVDEKGHYSRATLGNDSVNNASVKNPIVSVDTDYDFCTSVLPRGLEIKPAYNAVSDTQYSAELKVNPAQFMAKLSLCSDSGANPLEIFSTYGQNVIRGLAAPSDPSSAVNLEYVQSIACESDDYPGCYYRMVNGVKEWLNPPMEVGTEYRTTERWNGKAVYTALINCGKFPSAGVKNVSHGLSASQIVRCIGTTDYFGIVLPYTDPTSNSLAADAWAHKNLIFLRCNNAAWADFDCFVQLWYTKD